MAISADKTKLYVDRTVTPNKGITLDEIAACLKDYRKSKFGRDVGLLCTSPNINKWSKNKPIKHRSYGPLTDSERVGEDRTEGYLYGVKCLALPNKLSDLHQYTYKYRRPFGGLGVSPYRMMDFDGYDHNAAPTIEGWFADSANKDLAVNFPLRINVGGTTTGIDISDVIRNAFSIPSGSDIWAQPLYPCLMVGNYVQVCKNSRVGTPTPILYDGAYYYEYDADITTVPNLKKGSELFTMFLMMKDSFMAQYFDFTNGKQWTDVSETLGKMFSSYFVTLPNAAGISVNITEVPAPPQVIITGVVDRGEGGFDVGYDFDTWPEESITLTVKASYNGLGETKEITVSPLDGSGIVMKSFRFTYESLGLVYQAGSMVQIDVDMEASNGVKKTYATATYNVLMGGMQSGTIK